MGEDFLLRCRGYLAQRPKDFIAPEIVSFRGVATKSCRMTRHHDCTAKTLVRRQDPTRTSQTRSFFGPPVVTVTVAVIVVVSTTVTLLATGRAPDPFSKLTPMPAAKLEPLIVTGVIEPWGAVSGVMLDTATVLPVLLQPVLSSTLRLKLLTPIRSSTHELLSLSLISRRRFFGSASMMSL